ncbi:MAG: ABC-type multidrug transport system ATPase subunit [Cryomorphaceae bacterium]
MLELKDFCFTIDKDGEPLNLIDRVNLKIPTGHFMAIVGPSGCGKTTLLNTIAGLNEMSEGYIYWNGRDLEEDGDIEPAELGYVPQFSIAYDELTVDESIEAVTKLRVKTRDLDDLDLRIDRVLEETGLAPIADRMVGVLSGGQKRRLGLAMELVTDPTLLLCDEVTSGLDPRSERDIVRRLHGLSRREGGRIVISVTHSLAHLELYDSILVLHEGRVAYHGPPAGLTHYFSVEDTEEIYPRLAKQDSNKWRKSWEKHADIYYDKIEKNRNKLIEAGELNVPIAAAKKSASDLNSATAPIEIEDEDWDDIDDEASTKVSKRKSRSKNKSKSADTESLPLDDDDEIINESAAAVRTPDAFSQFCTLLSRRWKIFFRDRGQVFLQLAIMICFPLIVILFADQGNQVLLSFPDSGTDFSREGLEASKSIGISRAKVGGAVSGIIMFQMVLLALMGSNNAAREIAGERKIMEKEKFGGVSPFAYLLSKITFLTAIILVQSLIMAIAVESQWSFKGTGSTSYVNHFIFLVMINAAMTFICLGISSMMKTAEKASLLSIYLVGFQLPLSGAVLALPDTVGMITRPFISAYWAWAGSLRHLRTDYYAAVKDVTETKIDYNSTSCMTVLGAQILIGLILTYIGIRRHQWEH